MQQMEQDPRLNEALKIILNQEFEIVSISEQWCEMLKCSPAAAKGQSINNFLSDKHSFNQVSINSSIDRDLEVEMISCEGLSLFMDLFVINVENHYALYGHDVTALRKAQIKLRQLEHHAKVGYWEHTREGLSFWSNEIFNIFEVPVSPVTREFYASISNYYIGDGRKLILTNLERILNQGGTYDLELEIKTVKGKRKWVRTIGTGVMHNGKIIRAEGSIQDVSIYRENLLRLFESQERLQFALAANDMGVWKLNLHTHELIWDANMCKIYGLEPEQAPKNSDDFFKLIFPEDVERLTAESLAGIKTSERAFGSWFRIQVDGKTRYIATRSGYAHTLGSDFYIGVNWDITREKESEETIKIQEAKIITSARLSSLGEMAGGIAHEINNPLSVILARASQLKRRSLRGSLKKEEIVEGLTKVEETCKRIVKIINGLRTISRDGAKDPFEPLALQMCIKETVTLISEKLKNNNVQLELILPSEDITVNGRIVQLEQVLMNVLHNSHDAIAALDQKKISIKLIKDGDMAEIRISDSGQGVPKHLVEKIFIPFFTTKDIGKGTGIGLSISKSIVEEHGGEFTYFQDSKEWYFSLTLPVL